MANTASILTNSRNPSSKNGGGDSSKPHWEAGTAGPALSLPPSRCGLLTLDVVAYLRRKSIRAIRQLVEGGQRGAHGDPYEWGFKWVWNVAVNPAGGKRDLRFWVGEVIAPEPCIQFALPQVIELILPPARKTFPAGELTQMFLWQDGNLRNLRRAGVLPDGKAIPRAALVKFLTERLIQ